MESELAFFAARLPSMIYPVLSDTFGSRMDRQYRNYTLTGHVDSVISSVPSNVILSPEQKSIVKIWCQSLGVPVLNWQAQLAEIRALDISKIEEINRISTQEGLRSRHLKTQDSISQAYQSYRSQLLTTAYGHLFNDTPYHFPCGDSLSNWTQVENLRRLSRQKQKHIEETLSTGDEVNYSTLATQKLELSVRITGLTVFLTFIRRSWDLGLDDRLPRAYTRLKKQLYGDWPGRLSLKVMQRLVGLRTVMKERLLEPQGSAQSEGSKITRLLASLEDFFDVADNPALFKPDDHDGVKNERSMQVKLDHPKNARAEVVRSEPDEQSRPESSAIPPASLQSSDLDASSQRIAALRSKLFDAPRDTSRNVIEDEIRRLEQSFKVSSPSSSTSAGGDNTAFSHDRFVRRNLDDGGAQPSTSNVGMESKVTQDHLARRINNNIRTIAGDHHNPRLLVDDAQRNDTKDKHLQRREAQRFGIHEATSRQPQMEVRSSNSSALFRKVDDDRASSLSLDRHIETKRARDRNGQDLGEMVEEMIPAKNEGRIPLESAVSPMFDSRVSTNKFEPSLSSDSAAISDLKIQVAELKDLIRGLIFQQMAIPGTYSEPPMLASMKPQLLAENSAPTAPVGKPATTPVNEPLLTTGKGASQKSIHKASPATPNVLKAPLKITYEMFPPDRESESTVTKAPPQVVQYQASQSLLDELFPEETKEVLAKEQKEGPGSPGRIPIPHVPLTPINHSGVDRRTSTRTDPVRQSRAKGPDLTPKTTALELRYASKSLTEEDFRSLIPRGLHMQEWTQRGEFVKVIPKRDPWTLEQTGNYYIVFNNEEDAKAYKQHVSHVHDLARQHTPTSLTSEIAPPPGYIINGEDVSGLVQSYALIPPQQKLFLQYLVAPFTPLQQSIFRRGGYAQILGEGREGVAQVLLVFLEGRQPSYYEISDAVHLDGKRRGLEWKLVPGEKAIRKVDMREPKKKEEASLFDIDGDFANEGEVDALSGLEAAEGGKRKRTVQDRARTPTYGQRWILSFQTVDEAKRFALQWHGRPFPWHDRAMKKRRGKGFGEQVLMVRAEYLW
ncbi:Serine/threonine-protein kinase [Venturia nashicola]|uniref:Serine/threonine-protein kinase n=1 Tax=Venturia nashicola TaxID=86259 RepID=A0A4Z1P802_9PEZI|nr:Serine/threonine-protein kinase [Venturia nashicola]